MSILKGIFFISFLLVGSPVFSSPDEKPKARLCEELLNIRADNFTVAAGEPSAKELVLRLRRFVNSLANLKKSPLSPEQMLGVRESALSLLSNFRVQQVDLAGPILRLHALSQEEDLSIDRLRKHFHNLEFSLYSLRYSSGAMARALYELRSESPAWWDNLSRRWEDPTNVDFNPLNGKIIYRRLEDPVVSYDWLDGVYRRQKFEIAEILKVEDHDLQSMIDFVRDNGGEVRLIRMRVLTVNEDKFVGWQHESPYFWVNLNRASPSFLKPVIGIDLTGDRALAAFHHEMQHFKIWLENYHVQRSSGLDHEAATRAAVDHVWQQDMIVYGERRAVEAEMQAERDYPDHPFNQGQGKKLPINYWEMGYISRITYPEYQVVRQILHQHANNDMELDLKALRHYLEEMVRAALDIRAQAKEYLRVNPDDQLESRWRSSSISDLLLQPYGRERLEQERTLLLFEYYLNEICREITSDQELCR